MRKRVHSRLLRLRIPTFLGLLLLISSGRILVTRRRLQLTKKPVSSSVLVAPARNTKESFTSSSTVVEVNDRSRRLLEIILSTEEFLQQDEQSDAAALPPWPSYLTLYSPKDNHPHIASTINEIPAQNNASDSSPDFVKSCIVTAYFRIPNKYSSDTYENDWIAKMLGSISDCMVIFCEEHMAEKMRTFRNGAPTTTAIVTMRLEDLPVAHYYYPSNTNPWWWLASHIQRTKSDPATSYWRHQFQLDPEQQIHRSYQLFWIWLSKSWFVSTAILLQPHLFPVGTTTPPSIHYWMWADIGSFREESIGRTQLIRHPEVLIEDAADVVVWMAHQQPNPPRDPLWNDKLQQPQHFYQSGSHGLGTATAWIEYHAAFVTTLELYKGRFVGEDQCVLQSTCRLHPNLCAYVLHHQVPDNSYFGLRHVLKNGPDPTLAAPSLQLWRPPPL